MAAVVNRRLWGTPLALAWLMGSMAMLSAGSAGAHGQEASCDGTLLQLNVSERGTTHPQRFRYSLQLQAEAESTAAALQALNQQLINVRDQLRPLSIGDLTIAAPRTYAIGGSDDQPLLQRAVTRVLGEVSPSNYDALIQTAGRLPGVQLQGMTSLAAVASEQKLEADLLRRALAKGSHQADNAVEALGLRRVRLLRIDQRSGGQIRSQRYAAAAPGRFDPGEAPKPEQRLDLSLDYCLS